MIVNPRPNGWQIIYHRAHALLAAQIGGQWRRKDASPRFYETIAAISHHDDLEREWEEDNLTSCGAPQDFMMATETSYPLLEQHLENSLYRSRWVALLTSVHLYRLSKNAQGTSTEADKFLETQLKLQQQYRKELKTTKSDVEKAYAFMQWCDRFSLILCQQQLPADERALEISKDYDGQVYNVIKYNNNLLTVIPWCFEEDEFTVNVEASTLTELKFKDSLSLKQALKQAPRESIEWTFIKDESQSVKQNKLA